VEWYNELRPHRSLGGQTPDEIYTGEKGHPPEFITHDGNLVKLDLVVSHHRGQEHLPVVELRKAA
jgi:Cu2+-containing amine oxidase